MHEPHCTFLNWMIKCDFIWKHWFSVPLGDLWNTVFDTSGIVHLSFLNRLWLRISAQYIRWLMSVHTEYFLCHFSSLNQYDSSELKILDSFFFKGTFLWKICNIWLWFYVENSKNKISGHCLCLLFRILYLFENLCIDIGFDETRLTFRLCLLCA